MYFNFLRWGALLWKFALIGKLCYLKNCVTLKDCITWRLWYLKNCVTLRNCDTLKTDFLLNNYVIERLRWGALLVKYCVGVRYFRNFFTVKMLRCLKNDFIWKLRYLENCVTLKNCVTRELCYAGKLWY